MLVSGPWDTSLLVMIALCLIGAVGLTFSIRDEWWGRSAGSRLWNLIETGLGLFLMIVMLFTMAIQVIVRYSLAEYLFVPWTEELSRLFLVWIAFWGAATIQRSDGHIAVDVFYHLLGPTARLYVRLFGDIATLAFLTIVVWQGGLVAMSQLPIPMITVPLSSALFALSVPACGGVMIVHTVLMMMVRRRTMSIENVGPLGA